MEPDEKNESSYEEQMREMMEREKQVIDLSKIKPPKPSGKKAQIQKTINKICEEREGKIIIGYTKSDVKLRLECKEGHQWETRYSVIKSGSWCPNCFKRRNRSEDFKNRVESLGGRVIGEYENMQEPILVECCRQHKFEIRPSYLIYNNRWCYECMGKKKRTPNKELASRRRKSYRKEPRCKYITKFGPNKGKSCKRKAHEDGFCRYHITFVKKSSGEGK